jgi:hypothetical protein
MGNATKWLFKLMDNLILRGFRSQFPRANWVPELKYHPFE